MIVRDGELQSWLLRLLEGEEAIFDRSPPLFETASWFWSAMARRPARYN